MNFEKLEVWKRSARLSAEIYKETTDLNDFGFRNQLVLVYQYRVTSQKVWLESAIKNGCVF